MVNELPDITLLPPHGYVKLLRVAGPWHDDDIADAAHAARVSFNASEDYPRDRALKLVDYLWAHRHTTPFEMIETWWEVKLPIFVARQLVRHRTVSINEVSRRYVTDPVEFYLPEVWRGASENKKQGSSDSCRTNAEIKKEFWNAQCKMEAQGGPVTFSPYHLLEEARDTYQMLLDIGVCPEQARMILPVCTYTRWLWHQDLHNLLHMLSLRIDAHAQKETRDVAIAMLSLLAGKMPEISNMVDK